MEDCKLANSLPLLHPLALLIVPLITPLLDRFTNQFLGHDLTILLVLGRVLILNLTELNLFLLQLSHQFALSPLLQLILHFKHQSELKTHHRHLSVIGDLHATAD